MKAVRELANRENLKVHLDGARVFNAAVAMGVEPIEITQHVDSVTLCLSKGLGCPFGAVISGTAAFIARAKIERDKIIGRLSGMGLIGALALHALNNYKTQMTQDHASLKKIFEKLPTVGGGGKIELISKEIASNMVYFKFTDQAPVSAEKASEILKADWNILMDAYKGVIRIVTHQDVTEEHCERLILGLDKVLT